MDPRVHRLQFFDDNGGALQHLVIPRVVTGEQNNQVKCKEQPLQKLGDASTSGNGALNASGVEISGRERAAGAGEDPWLDAGRDKDAVVTVNGVQMKFSEYQAIVDWALGSIAGKMRQNFKDADE